MSETPQLVSEEIEISCCGRTWWVARELALLRRIEQRFGALYPFCLRLERGETTFAELLGVLSLMLEVQPDAPSRAELEAWLFSAGTRTPARALALPLYTLAMSEAEREALKKRQERLPQTDRAAGAGEQTPGPFAPTAAPTGPGCWSTPS